MTDQLVEPSQFCARFGDYVMLRFVTWKIAERDVHGRDDKAQPDRNDARETQWPKR